MYDLNPIYMERPVARGIFVPDFVHAISRCSRQLLALVEGLNIIYLQCWEQLFFKAAVNNVRIENHVHNLKAINRYCWHHGFVHVSLFPEGFADVL